MDLQPWPPRLEWGRRMAHATREAGGMEVTQAPGLASAQYVIPATFPSLLSTNRTVTNPLDHKIQGSINTPWPPGARTLADKEQNTNQSKSFLMGPAATLRPPRRPTNNQVAARLDPRGRAPGLPLRPPCRPIHLPGSGPPRGFHLAAENIPGP